jgi:hypothetical protein
LAHGFAIRYDLPLPLGFFLAGAGATIALSFLLLAVFAKESPARPVFPPAHPVSPAIRRMLSNRWVAGTLQSISVALFFLVVATALFGDTNPFKNISTTMVWLIWWVGMMFINTFIGDLWALINPWNVLFAAAEKALHALKSGVRLSLDRPYPAHFGVWPAVILFLAFAWVEIISGEGEDVRKLGALIIGYSLITWSGMVVFGRSTWLTHGEAFTVVFSTFARLAPVAFTDRALVLRPPGAGLLVRKPVSWSTAAMVLALLASVTFDGFIATPAWTALYENFTALAQHAPGLGSVFNFYTLATAVFLLFPVIFGVVFLTCCHLTASIAGGITTGEAARYFVLTLLPIAIAYHVAHYLVFFLLTGQYVIPAMSDPFGYEWDPLRHRLVQAGHRADRRPIRVVYRRHRHRRRARDRSLSCTPDGAVPFQRPEWDAGKPVSAPRADGGLHHAEPLDHRPAGGPVSGLRQWQRVAGLLCGSLKESDHAWAVSLLGRPLSPQARDRTGTVDARRR